MDQSKWRGSSRGLRCAVAAACLVGAAAGAQEMQGRIRVAPEGQFVFDKPISKVQFSPSLKFEFEPGVRAAKVRVEIDLTAGPSRDGVAFALPPTTAKAVDVNSYQSEIALEIPDGALPGTYQGSLKFLADPPSVLLDPKSIPFKFTIVEANIEVRWEDNKTSLRLGSVTTGSAGSFVGPSVTVIMDEGVESGTRVNFESKDLGVWLRPVGGEPLKGVGALSAGTYELVLDPAIPAGKYKGQISFNVLSVGTKINDQTPPVTIGYDLKVSSPLVTLLKIVAAIVVLAILGAGVFVALTQMKGKQGASGKPLTVEGTLEFIVPMERRPEKLERVGKSRVVFGDKGDLLKDVRRIHFDLAAYDRDGKTVVELTRFKDSCPVYVNGVEAFNVEVYDNDIIKFGEYPTFEVKYRNSEIEREVSQVFGDAAEAPAAGHAVAAAAPTPLSLSSGEDEGQLESLSGESRPMTSAPVSHVSDEFEDLEPPSAAPAKKSGDDLSLDLDLDIDAPAPPGTKKGKDEKGGDSIDLPEGFDLLGDDK